MRSHIHPFPENSLVGSCIRLAQTTFFDAMPARADVRVPKAPVTLPPAKAEPLGQRLARWTEKFDNWMYRQRLEEREAYLAQAQDVFDLERRMRNIERRPYY